MNNPALNRIFPGWLAIAVAAFVAALLLVAATSASPLAVGTSGLSGARGPSGGNHAAAPSISENEAHGMIWALPEVQSSADHLRQHGVKPVTLTVSRPTPSAPSGSAGADFVIQLAEDHGSYTVPVDTFSVDAYTKTISVYDVISDKTVPLEEWRSAR